MTNALEDFRRRAAARLPRFLFDYIDGGALAEETLRRNTRDFQDLHLNQRVLRDISAVRTDTVLWDEPMAAPIVLAPVGMAGMNARRGEVQASLAAHRVGVPFCLSTVSLCPVQELVDRGAPPPWFQLYMTKDRSFVRDMLDQAWESGCRTLVFTVDMPVPGLRYRDRRSGLSGGTVWSRRLRQIAQAAGRPRWCWDVGIRGRPHTLGHVAPRLTGRADIEAFWSWMAANFDPSVTWRDLEQLRGQWRGRLIVKGVLSPDDAHAACLVGADAIVVSNHGGRQLDGASSSIRALPMIAGRVGGRVPLLLDGGIRGGPDILRALALGATAVMIGRPWVYGLAAAGGQGVEDVLTLLINELRLTLALCGHASVADVGAHTLVRSAVSGIDNSSNS